MLGPNDLPFAVTGERAMILEKPPKDRTEGGLYVPEVAKMRYFEGTLLAAGLKGLDKLYDHGYQIGDRVKYGLYAGLREAWDHIVEGDHTLPDDAYDWHRCPEECNASVEVYRCRKTGAKRVVEAVIILNTDDLLGSIELAERFRRKEMAPERGIDPEGKTTHYIERK